MSTCPNCGRWLNVNNKVIWDENEEKGYCKLCVDELFRKIDKKIRKLELEKAKIEYKRDFEGD